MRLIAGASGNPRIIDPWLIAYLAATVVASLALAELGHKLWRVGGRRNFAWPLIPTGLCIASLVLLPVGVLLLAFVYLLVEVDPRSSTRKERG